MARRSQIQTPPLAVIEEGCHLLRRIPLTAWVPYVAGSALFVMVCLRFWSEMSRAPDGADRLPVWSLALVLAYGLMKAGHAAFGECLLDRMRGGAGRVESLGVRKWLKLVAGQIVIHSTMPWVLLLSSLAMLPFAWAYAFYHNASILAVSHHRAGGSTSGLVGRALRASHHSAKQNHTVILCLSVFAFLVWINFLVLAFVLPSLAEALTGIGTAFSRSPAALMNSSLLASVTAMTWLCASPFFRAAYAVRCFESDAEKSGDDLRAALRVVAPVSLALVLATLLLPGTGHGSPSECPIPGEVLPERGAVASSEEPVPCAAEAPSPPPGKVPELDKAIRKTLSHPDYRWRLPRERAQQAENSSGFDSSVRKFFQSFGQTIAKFGNWLRDLFRRLFGDRDSESPAPGGGGGLSALGARRVLLWLGILLVVGLIMLVVRWFLHREKKSEPALAQESAPVDLHDENLSATDLPEDEWLRLAREKLAAGDVRLAMRALFLGTLARLGQRGLLAVMAGKTNGMYVRELAWRARGRDSLQEAFRENVGAFERSWYGLHPVSGEVFERFQTNHRLITDHELPA